MFDDLISGWNLKKEDFRLGIVVGLFFLILLVQVFSYASTFQQPFPMDTYSLEVNTHNYQLGFPSHKEPTDFKLYINNISRECMHAKIEFYEGLTREGDYCEGESTVVKNKKIKIDKILDSDVVDKPVSIKVYRLFNLKWFFNVLLFVLPIIGIYIKVKARLDKKEEQGYRRERDALAKELKMTPEQLEKLKDYFDEE